MANTITLHNYTVGVNNNAYVFTSYQADDQKYVNIMDEAVRLNYPSFDGAGIYLKDETLTLPEEGIEQLPAVTADVYTTSYTFGSSPPRIELDLDTAYDFDNGIYISLWKNVASGTLKVGLGQKGTTTETVVYASASIINGKASFPASSFKSVKTRNKIYILPKENSTITFTGNNCFFGVTGIDFGYDYNFPDIVGTINCYGEVAPVYDDLPAGSCDVTVVSEHEPQKGQEIVVNSTYFNGKYIIDQITREAEDIFTIQCYDAVRLAESTYRNSSDSTIDAGTFSNLLADTDGSVANFNWSSKIVKAFTGIFEAGTTTRQALSMWQTATGMWVTAFNDTVGIHPITQPTTVSSTITADRILGKASVEHRQDYKGVELTQKAADGTEYKYKSAVSKVQGNNLGYYSDSNSTLRASGEAIAYPYNTIEFAKRYVNGDEITADIVYNGEALGSKVSIETPYNGTMTGIVKSLELQIGKNHTIATIVIREVS